MMGFFKKLHNKVTPPDANAELRLGKYAFSLGENVEGSLALSSREDFDATEIRCEIACTEEAKTIRYEYDPAIRRSIPREVMQTAVLFSAKPVLSAATHISNGENREFPIKTSIPPGARLTYQGMDRRVTWTIKGVIAVDGRPDVNTHMAEIQVIQPVAAAPASPTVVKEVVREIVRIPCRYCSTLFDQVETTCPTCGAKRTA
jgi:hypothetical protein